LFKIFLWDTQPKMSLPTPTPALVLNDQQKKAIQAALRGENLFITGCAGTGKSELQKQLLKALTATKRVVVITAMTGTAAYNIEGVTLNSFAGVFRGEGTAEQLLKSINECYPKKKEWLRCDALFVDEISMLSKELLDKLNYIAQHVRRMHHLPFGGIQVIFVGDFYQLAPINAAYAFESDLWKSLIHRTIVLRQVYRQNESKFIEGLNQVREGILTDEFIELLNQARIMNSFGVTPTRLYAVNKDVDLVNARELESLNDPLVSFPSFDTGKEIDQYAAYAGSFSIGKTVMLKVGAQIILLKNMEDYKNGTRGVVLRIINKGDPEEVERRPESSSEEEESEEDEEGEGEGGVPVGVVVRCTDGRTLNVFRARFEIMKNKVVVACREGLPVKLAWALTIHRAQGLNIDCLEVFLAGIRCPHQAYVALSRATSLSGLQVHGLSKSVVYCDPKVKAFYNQLEDEEGYENEDLHR